ncbi:MAG: T9SS type A sorting domain-containing protein, partial [bacterium]
KIPIDYVKGVEYYTVISLPYSGTYTYRFAAKDRNGVLALGTPTQEYIGPILTGVDAPVAPLLLWTGERNYLYDGLDPEQGEPNSTIFTYRVKYSDGNNEAPLAGYPRVKIKTTGGTETILSLTRVSPATVTYAAGVLYETRTTLPVPTGVYTYQFEAKDITGLTARGAGTQVKIAPAVNSAPVLSNGTVNPTNGNVSTLYTFSVRYQDSEGYVPYPGYPKVHILIGGVDIPGSPIILPYHDGGNISSGRVYSNPITLSYNNSNYSYYFEAMDIYRKMATPTSTYYGPVVTGGGNCGPELLWVGTGGYVSDGLEPEIGTRGTIFTFKVRYRDLNNDQPKPGYPQVHIKTNEGTYTSLKMNFEEGVVSCGVYMATTTLSRITNYTYYIEAFEDNPENNSIRLPLKVEMKGPRVTNAPILTWTGESGFESDGVNPDYGTVNSSSFTYKVRYYDTDGNLPKYVHLWIYKDGKRIFGSPFPMGFVPTSGNLADGDYYANISFTESGTYSYLIEAKEKLGINLNPLEIGSESPSAKTATLEAIGDPSLVGEFSPSQVDIFGDLGEDELIMVIWADGVSAVGPATLEMVGPIVKTEQQQNREIKLPPPTPQIQITDLQSVYCYPNPTKKGEITFANLPQNRLIKIRIFNIVGELVYEEEREANSGGKIIWTCRNSANERVASGIYIYILTDRIGNMKRGKLGIIR